MKPLNFGKYISISDIEIGNIIGTKIGSISSIMELHNFCQINGVIMNGNEIIEIEVEWISQLIKFSLSKGAYLYIKLDSDLDNVKKILILHKILRINDLKIETFESNYFLLKYTGITFKPKNIEKQIRYEIADFLWDLMIKIEPLRLLMKLIYTKFRKFREFIRGMNV